MVAHHDHMYDYVHQLILDHLSPRIPYKAGHRENFGSVFADFLRKRGRDALERIEAFATRNGAAIIRFNTTNVCSCFNAVDGNGKTHPSNKNLDYEDLRFWSMRPDELEAVRARHLTWIEVYDRDTHRATRRENAQILADDLVREYRAVEKS